MKVSGSSSEKPSILLPQKNQWSFYGIILLLPCLMLCAAQYGTKALKTVKHLMTMLHFERLPAHRPIIPVPFLPHAMNHQLHMD